jgi:hypothetical protein
MTYRFEDFTEVEYRRLLTTARERWRFISFDEALTNIEHVALWRHDVDFSPQRALRLAQIENEVGVLATYFVLLTSTFYNALEPSVAATIRSIVDLGHQLGLHFDAGLRRRLSGDDRIDTAVRFDKQIIEEYFGTPVHAVSYHNPDVPGGVPPDHELVANLVNAYGQPIRERYSYVSDSNGYWRHRRLADVLEARTESRLHVLTHPEWWTPEPMSPRDRVTRCIDGRSRRQHIDYDALLERHQRTNVR